MAIDFTDITAITDTLKLVYGEGIQQQFAQEETLYNRLPKSSQSIGGKGYEFAVTFADPQGIGARAESAKMPDPLAGKFDTAQVTPKYVYGSSRLTGPALEAGKGNVAAFIDSQSNQVQGIYRSFLHDLNRQCWGDGYGLLGTLSAVSDTLSTSTTWDVTCDNDRGTRYMRPGMVVDFYESNTFDQSSVASRISSINYNTNVVTMEANASDYKTNHPNATAAAYTVSAATIASAAVMVRMGARAVPTHSSSATQFEMMGLLGIFDDSTLLTTFQNINASTFTQWRANILSNSSVNREITEDLLLDAADTTRRVSGKDPNVMYMGQGQRRKIANLYLGDVRFMPQQLKGGYETLTFSAGGSNIEMVVDPIGQPNRIFMTTTDAIEKFELRPLGWLDYDQQMHQRAGYDEWDFILAIYANIGTAQRNCNTLISDLTEPT